MVPGTNVDLELAKNQWNGLKRTIEEAEQVTNQIYGGISPLGLPDNLKIFIDKNVMNRKKLFIGAGNRISKFFLSPELLVDLTKAEVLDLT